MKYDKPEKKRSAARGNYTFIPLSIISFIISVCFYCLKYQLLFRLFTHLPKARIHWMKGLALELGGEQKARDMIKGKGVSLILGELSIKYRRPVVYPDTVSVYH